MKLFTLVGPTGIGKTEIAIELAKKYDLDIVSADSRQIYKYMDIGTAKPKFSDSDQRFTVSGVRFHLIDIITPNILYSAVDFAQDCEKVIKQLTIKERNFVLVGGSGLYLKALFEPFFTAPARDLKIRRTLEKEPLERLYERLKLIDPISAQLIKPADRQRIIRALEIYEQTRKPLSEQKQKGPEPKYSPFYVGLTMPRKFLYNKINNRFDQMIEDGLVDEVKSLLKMGYTKEHKALNGIGYQEIIRFLYQEISLMQAIYLAKARSRQYAKRQMTWFKKLKGIKWIEYTILEETISKVRQEYEKYLKLT